MNYYSCESCDDKTDTLISHSKITGNQLFCLRCFRTMCGLLTEYRGFCPLCLNRNDNLHEKDCIYGRLMHELAMG